MLRVLFLADQFSDATRTENDKYPGGAELTDAAAIEACPWPIECATPVEFDPQRLADFDLHIIGNFETAPPALIAALAQSGRHILFEHDVRICQWNGNFPSSWEKMHRQAQWCSCPHPKFATLYRTALATLFLTHRQLAVYRANPYFDEERAVVLGSSLMNRDFFEHVARAQSHHGEDNPKAIDWAVVYSRNAIKGFEAAREYCRKRGIEPYVIADKSPVEVLEILARTHNFVYVPQGLEPAGRMLIEARFLAGRVLSNPNAGVAGESWWNLHDAQALEVVRDAPHRFWRIAKAALDAYSAQEQEMAEDARRIKPVRARFRPDWRLAAPASNLTLRALETVLPDALIHRTNRRVKARAQDVRDITGPARAQ